MIDSILVVCVGNICRSPIGERLLRKKIITANSDKTLRHKAIRLGSAGIGALVGEPADPMVCKIAATDGLDMEDHVAQQFTPEMGKAYSLLLVMETGHRKHISRMAPELSGRIMLFDHWTGARGIPDPYRQSCEFHETVYRRIEEAATAWASKLTARKEHRA
ncbi:protein-tyrosine phosphatase [Roseinatronobacter thiooxidans]|uniref:protein-tyrosine-phosphatase n=1 Tax=Roseinatronobacter thiooxidans TaxID=121821 RepID=A0A2W7QC50_9RHOB|nr:low molecular weight protein-tyrosine-phosphatase [Roseinatronobacter thiooxidans]PZX45743.1 protein-tyrosine phosphatase [Roseinatronobacter thiooxidans]